MKKKPSTTTSPEPNEMLPEYELSGKQGIRGKYYQEYRQGHTVRVFREDGTEQLQYFTLEDGAVMLEPDVREYFPTSESVNNALRSLITLLPEIPAKKLATIKTSKRSIKS